jgi:polyribonucleotide nucleotidyltransferase
MFQGNMRNDVQVIVTVLCIDGVHEPDVLAVNAASAALHISKIPFDGPVASVRVGKLDNQYVVNPTNEQQEKSSLDLIVCGTSEHIIMVEAGAKLVAEEEIVEAIKFAQKYLGQLCRLQEDFRKEAGKEKVPPILEIPDEQVLAKVKEFLTGDKIEKAVYVPDKERREQNIRNLKNEVLLALRDSLGKLPYVDIDKEGLNIIDEILKKYQQRQILDKERRVDGRKLDETRPVTCEVGVLPRTHGSALFTRGETQGLTTVTLGSKGDEQILDSMEDPMEGRSKRYIHHYNMPGYSVGEVTPIRGPGRREIGHGALAERAVQVVLPPQEEFPYTMRLVAKSCPATAQPPWPPLAVLL